MFLSEKIAFIGIGQCGGNIVKDLEDVTSKYLGGEHDIQSYYVNTSIDDLEATDAPLNRRYHISGTQGMAKDHKYAFEVITKDDNDAKVAEAIYGRYANAKMYFLVFSSSGGTGGGMANAIAKKLKEYYPEKIINAVVVKPHDEEDMKMQYNAKNCLATVKQYIDDGYYTSIQLLDNNKFEFNKKLELNKRYVRTLTKIIHLDVISKEGNLDDEEMERLFSRVGMVSFHEVSNKDFETLITKYENNSMFFKQRKTAKTHGLILNPKNNTIEARNMIREQFGVPMESHHILWDEDTNIIITSAIEFSDDVLNNLAANYNKLKKMRDDISNSYNNESFVEVTADFSDMVEQERQPKETVIIPTNNVISRGRRGKKLQGLLDLD